MIDPNNQNYFALGEDPQGSGAPVTTVVPWWKVRANQMKVLAVFGVLVGIGVVGYYGYQMYSLTHVDVAKVDQANEIIARASQNCESDEDPAACEARARSEAARTTGQVTVCDGLEDAEFQNCVVLIALDKADPEVCNQLSGSAESTCTDDANLVAAQRAQDYGKCSSILDSAKKTICQAQMLSIVIAAGECQKYGIDDATCDYPAELEAVIATGNPTGCTKFSSEKKTECEDMFSSLDRDGDGMSRLAEYKIGTSDDAADTDGDGYTDSEEVESGHDPLT